MKTLDDIFKIFPELNEKSDMGEQLNQLYYSKILNGDSIYLWGRGNTAKNLLREIPYLNIKAFVDNNVTEGSVYYNGKEVEVIDPENLEDGVYIIVASIYYEEICNQLKKMGKNEYLDFISYRYLLPTPKAILLEIIDTPSVTNWKCVEAMRIKRLQSDGGCSFCACPAWTKQSLVNVFLDRESIIEENIKARLFFYSIFSGKYTFCKKQDCPGLMNNWNNFQSENMQYKMFEKEDSHIAKVVMPDFDHTCNLYCKKCRMQIIHESGPVFEYFTDYFITKWMPYSNLTKLAGNGEVMASKYYRKILKNVGNQEGVVVYSNGLLLKKSVVTELSKEIAGNCFFIISIDAVKKDTYNKLQCGGDFDILMENLRGISELTKSGEIKGFMPVFVISKENEIEMDEFIDLMRNLGAEAVTFLPLKNFGTYSLKEFEELSLFTEDNKPKTKVLENKILQLQQREDIKVFFCDLDATTLAYEYLGFE